MKKTEHKQAVKLIQTTYSRLARVMEIIADREWSEYIAIVSREEKGHRHFCPDGVQCGLTLSQSMKQFAAGRIFEFWCGEREEPKAQDYFMFRRSIFAAYALWFQHQTQIMDEFSMEEAESFLNLNYAELNKDPRSLED